MHNLQGQLGCLPRPNEHTYLWLVEGGVTYLGWQTVRHAGRVSQADIVREMRARGGFSPELKPLERYERTLGGDPEYALAHRAVAQLIARAGTPSLLDCCAQLGAGKDWKAAFHSRFGVTVSAFYAAFEASRKP